MRSASRTKWRSTAAFGSLALHSGRSMLSRALCRLALCRSSEALARLVFDRDLSKVSPTAQDPLV